MIYRTTQLISLGRYGVYIVLFFDSDLRTPPRVYIHAHTSDSFPDLLDLSLRYMSKPSSFSWHVWIQPCLGHAYNAGISEFSSVANVAAKFISFVSQQMTNDGRGDLQGCLRSHQTTPLPSLPCSEEL